MASLAIVTARGGSKRIPRKNIRPFLGKPIIAYSIAAAQDWRRALTPAAMPPGCANNPPPARKSRSADCSRSHVGAACLTVWPDENTGITVQGLSANIGLMHARAEAITLSSSSWNLLAIPLTCM